jgi:hypothetical protein
MMWEYWINLYTGVHCSARGLRYSTINAYSGYKPDRYCDQELLPGHGSDGIS